jgi:hypothetical protein
VVVVDVVVVVAVGDVGGGGQCAVAEAWLNSDQQSSIVLWTGTYSYVFFTLIFHIHYNIEQCFFYNWDDKFQCLF